MSDLTLVRPKKTVAQRILGVFSSSIVNIVLLIVAVFWLVPTVGLFITSLRTAGDIAATGWWTVFTAPAQLTVENYTNLLSNTTITGSFLNTIVIAVPTTILVVMIGAIAAYGFAFLQFPGRDWLLIVVIISCINEDLNVGFLAIGFAIIVAGVWGDTKGAAVLNYFPTSLFMILVGVTFLFGMAQTNGTMEKLTAYAVRATGGNVALMPLVVFMLTTIITTIGPGNIAGTALMLLGCILSLVYLVARQIAKPLGQLAHVADDMGEAGFALGERILHAHDREPALRDTATDEHRAFGEQVDGLPDVLVFHLVDRGIGVAAPGGAGELADWADSAGASGAAARARAWSFRRFRFSRSFAANLCSRALASSIFWLKPARLRTPALLINL